MSDIMTAMRSVFSQRPIQAEPGSGGAPAEQNPQGGQSKPQNQNNNEPSISDPSHPNNQKPADPLAAFSKIFDNPDESTVKKPPSFKLDPTVIKGAADSLNFSEALTPEILAKLKAGDDSGYVELANALGRKIYSQSLEHSSALTDRFVSLRSEHDQSNLGRQMNSHLAKNSLESIAASNPTAKKMLDFIADGIVRTNPDATPEFIAEQTPKFFLELAKLTNPDAFDPEKNGASGGNGQGGNQKNKGKDIDWNAWLTDGS